MDQVHRPGVTVKSLIGDHSGTHTNNDDVVRTVTIFQATLTKVCLFKSKLDFKQTKQHL